MFGVAFAAMATTNFLFSPFWGKVAKNMGIIKSSAICFVGYALGQGVFGIATTEWMIVLGRLISGFFIGGITVTQMLYIIQESSDEDRGVNLAIAATLTAVFSPFGYLIGGFLGDYSIPLTFLLQVIGLAGTGVLFALLLKDKKIEEKEKLSVLMKGANPFKVVYESRKIMTKILFIFLMITFIGSFVTTGHEQVFNYYISDQLGFSSSSIGSLKALVGFVSLIANSTICLWIMKKTNIQKSLGGILLVISLLLGIIFISTQDTMFVVYNILVYGFVAVYTPLLQANLSELSKKNSAVFVGVFNSIRSLGMVAGSLFAGFIYTYGPKLNYAYIMVAAVIACGFAYYNYFEVKKAKN